jgi:hypothetical protein
MNRLFYGLLLFGSAQAAVMAAEPFREVYSETWAAVDALGRSLPTAGECGPPKENRTVGLFYFLWLGQHSTSGPHDITQLLKDNAASPSWGPPGAFHHWGKSQLGYYTSDSVYVIGRHARMLSDAGVDVLIFDVTNAFTYPTVYTVLCEEFMRLRAAGQRTPQVMFLAHTNADQTIQTLFSDFYARELYKDLWFYWKGKPLIMGKPETLAADVKDFFTIRDCWAWTHGQDTWQWLDHWPQRYGWHESADRPEEMSVCAAEHPISNIGRSHYKGKQPAANSFGVSSDSDKGLYFSQQWERALEVGPDFLFITGWNEWVAQRFLKEAGGGPEELAGRPLKSGDTFFVDAYTQEYSRDIEPMEGGYGDNYYYQMVAGIRRYKGVRPPQAASTPVTIAIDGRFDDWAQVGPEFRDHIGDVGHRDEQGWGDAGRYVNTTGRNDLAVMKAARDEEYLYFYAETEKPLTAASDPNWMLLFINTDRRHKTGWEGYDFVVNLSVKDDLQTNLHALADGGWAPRFVETVRYAVDGNRLELAIRRQSLGIAAQDKIAVEFHWADHPQRLGVIEEFALNGDSAPDRRFNYLYFTE